MKLFRKHAIYLLKLLITTGFATATAAVHEDHPYVFVIERDADRLATHFQISSNDTYIGSVEKSAIRKRNIMIYPMQMVYKQLVQWTY